MEANEESLKAFISAVIKTGEAGSITAVVGGVLFMIIKLIKRNGCTCRLNSCKGEEILVMDCEEGAPSTRHRAPIAVTIREPKVVKESPVKTRAVTSRELKVKKEGPDV